MTPIPASLLPLATLVLALAGSAALEPVLEPNAAYATAGAQQARRDTRSCLRSAEFDRSSPHPDVTRTDHGRVTDIFEKKDRGRDPAYEKAVERCLEEKGYKVSGWE